MATSELITPLMALVTLTACVALVQVFGLYKLTETRNGRLASIDGLRGFLAIAVFFHHFYINYNFKMTGQWVNPSSSVYSLFGSGGVTLFFMITGFLFFGKIKAVRGNIDLDRFYLGRVFRILPVYGVSVALIYLMVFIMTGPHVDAPLSDSLDQWVSFHAANINNYPLTTYINAGVIWTLWYEWIFYFSIPIIAFVWFKAGLRVWAVGLAALLALYCQRNAVTIPYIDLSAGLFAPFLLGGLAGEVGRVAEFRRFAIGRWGSVLSICAAVAMFSAFSTAYCVSAYLILFVFFTPIALGNSIFGLLRLRAIIFLGEISYDVYMLHGIVMFALFTVAMPDALKEAHTSGRMLSLMLIAAAGVMLSSLVLHLSVERPMLRLGRKLAHIDNVQTLAAP